MKLRFDVDQAAAFRRGHDSPNSWCMIDVDPADLTPEDRAAIAARLRGIDVYPLTPPTSKTHTARLRSDTPDLDGLLAAIARDQRPIDYRTTSPK